MKGLVLFYSLYGHSFKLAEAAAEGLKEAGLEPILRKAPETLSNEVLKALGATETIKAWEHIPNVTIQDMEEADAVIIGGPTRFGSVCGQIKQFLDSTGGLFARGAMIGKIGAAFTSCNTQHGGQETTIWNLYPYFLHQGMLISGLPYDYAPQRNDKVIVGGSPYGASTVAGENSTLQPNPIDLDGAKHLGRHVGQLTKKLRA